MTGAELDVEFLMWELQRRLQTQHLPSGETVMCFTFAELKKFSNWWLVVYDDEVDLCTRDPGKEVDLYISSTVRTLAEVWKGDVGLRPALADGHIQTHGLRALERTLPDWLGLCLYKDVRAASDSRSFDDHDLGFDITIVR